MLNELVRFHNGHGSNHTKALVVIQRTHGRIKRLFADFTKAFIVSRKVALDDVNHVVAMHVGNGLQPMRLLLVSAVPDGCC